MLLFHCIDCTSLLLSGNIFIYFYLFIYFFYSYNTNYSTTKLQTQLITMGVWRKENQSPHTAKPSTVKSYGHCSSIKKLKVVVTNVYEPVWLMHHFWLWCVQRWYEGSEAQMVTKNQKFLQVGQSHTLPPLQPEVVTLHGSELACCNSRGLLRGTIDNYILIMAVDI